ncbi:MAG TPA: YobA family protein [Anaerovoracaceae bacterium]|nr:YobA family protein [Anaerovoracaceae bacterium]
MRRQAFLIVFLLISLFAGCGVDQPNGMPGAPDKEPGMTGYVMGKENERILVVDPVSQDFSSTGGVNEFYDAIWFSNIPEEIKEGDKVKVWFDAVADSYPGQSEAIRIEVLPAPRPDGADLDESAAINKALHSGEITTSWPTVLKSIEYYKETDTWEIGIRETIEEPAKTFHLQIKDE